MLKKEALQKIAALLKIKDTDLEAAILDEKEVDVTIDEKLSTFNEAELAILKKNTYKEGKDAGVEIAVKETREKLDLSFTGKTVEGLVEAAQKKALEDAKLAPDQRVQELNEKVKNLQATVTEKEQAAAQKEKEAATEKVKGQLYKYIPEVEGFDKDDIIYLMERNGLTPKIENGKLQFYKGETLVMDKLSNPVEPKDVISDFMKEKKMIASEGQGGGAEVHGRGGGSGAAGSKPTKLSELKAQFEKDGKSLYGDEFREAYTKAIAENKDFDLSN